VCRKKKPALQGQKKWCRAQGQKGFERHWWGVRGGIGEKEKKKDKKKREKSGLNFPVDKTHPHKTSGGNYKLDRTDLNWKSGRRRGTKRGRVRLPGGKCNKPVFEEKPT